MLTSFFGTPIGISFSNEIIMRSAIQFDGVDFWVDQNIIFCKFTTGFFKNNQKTSIEEIFYNAIPVLSNGKYMPILISLEEIGSSSSLKIFKIISNSALIKTTVLSRIFLVRTKGLKVMLSLNNIVINRDVPNKIFKDFNLAIRYCKKDYMVFNKVSQKILT